MTTTAQESTLDCDLLVIGGGMAGLSAAGYAAEHGARVVLLEKAPDIGGSAALSGGFVWTANSPERLQLYAGGRPELGEVVLRNYSRGLAWMREREITVGNAVNVLHGRGYQVDLPAHFASCVNLVEQHEGHVVVGTTVERLMTDSEGRVIGARTNDADGQVDVLARHTILATGGFQNSPELRAKYIHPQARDRVLLRTNPCSDGAGMRLASAVGAATSDHNPGFYGHLVSESPRWGQPGLYTTLTQYHSEFALLLNEQGERFCDESLGDHVNTGAVLAQSNARALCFWDSRIHQAYACTPVVKGAEVLDKMAVALEHGGRGKVVADWTELENFANAQGFAGRKVIETLLQYNGACRRGWETLCPRRAENFGVQDQPPFYALVVLPAITHTHAGIRVDATARVLRPDGSAVPGLLAAGVDAGDIYGIGYSGGLGLALAFGLQAAQTTMGAG
jgi:succinate dehydrogenase/fumarate reductase flavoprotein subunit